MFRINRAAWAMSVVLGWCCLEARSSCLKRAWASIFPECGPRCITRMSWSEPIQDSSAGDYLGIPLNDDDRQRADTWDADLISALEHQCIPHSAIYAMRAPSNLKISTIEDPTTSQIIAFVIDGTYTGPRTIWMDGRPHPSQFAAHMWAGFSTGVWEGDTLRIETTHIKSGYLRRNGIAFSDQATLTEFFDLHDRYLTLTSIAEDPVYLTEPLVRSESWVWNPYQVSRRSPVTVIAIRIPSFHGRSAGFRITCLGLTQSSGNSPNSTACRLKRRAAARKRCIRNIKRNCVR